MDAPQLTSAELLKKWQHVLDKTFDIFTWTSPGELCWLAECASRATTIFEIGCYHAKSTKTMALANSAAKMIACDLPESERCRKILIANLMSELERNQIYLHIGQSADAPWGILMRLADFAFIDGGHLFDDVSGDIANLLPHMAPGAILSGHDWRTDMNDGVNRGVLAHFKMEQIRVFESIWFVKLP